MLLFLFFMERPDAHPTIEQMEEAVQADKAACARCSNMVYAFGRRTPGQNIATLSEEITKTTMDAHNADYKNYIDSITRSFCSGTGNAVRPAYTPDYMSGFIDALMLKPKVYKVRPIRKNNSSYNGQ